MRPEFGGGVWAGMCRWGCQHEDCVSSPRASVYIRKGRGPRPEPWVNPTTKNQGHERESAKGREAAARGGVRKTRRGCWAKAKGEGVSGGGSGQPC